MAAESAAGDAPAAPHRLVGAYGLYYLDNQPVLLRAATVPYAEVPAAEWAPAVERLRAAGCNAVTSPLPWAWHAPAPGEADFTGRTHPQRDLAGFLRLVRDAGLSFLACPTLSPSPAETRAGYPPWLTEAIPEALARRPDGRPAAVGGRGSPAIYSLLHPSYTEQVQRWYGQLAAVLRPWIDRPLVGWQVDAGAGQHFGAGIGRLDFNADTVHRYRMYLRQRYETTKTLSRQWGRPVEDFGAILPPRGARRSAGELEAWQAFLEEWVTEYLAVLRDTLRRLGITLPLALAAAPEDASPQSPALQAPVLDFYGYAAGRRRPGHRPFGESQYPLRFQAFAAEERPLSAWRLGSPASPRRPGGAPLHGGHAAPPVVREVVGAVAHGVKGYALHPAGLESAGPAMAALQAVLDRHSEELTASVEAHDAIAYLDYQRYSRYTPEDFLSPGAVPAPVADPFARAAKRARLGLHALLLTCGYNPPLVELQAVTDEQLGEYPAAVFPALDYIDLDDYGKLVVFTLRGGSLVTFPQPATRQPDGSPLNTRFLWPHPVRRRRSLGRWQLLARAAWRWLAGGGKRPQDGEDGPGAPAGRPLLQPAGEGAAVRADYHLVSFAGVGEPVLRYGRTGTGEVQRAAPAELRAEVLLRHGDETTGYRVQVRSGTSTVIGTVIGGAYVSSLYAALPAGERLALRRLALGLFEEIVPRRIVPDPDLEVEVTARLSPDGGCLLFILNRLGAQAGRIRFPAPEALNLSEPLRAEVLFRAGASQAVATADGVQLDLAAGDALIARLW
ncbi:MAG TPA: beta-galactosidase [Chloroflexota bacterium]|nr:beta-galactosidase [Chloroflexota bacterium]